MYTIAIANHKGGTLKTETTLRLGLGLAEAGQAPLLIDLDPQGNLTRRLGGLATHRKTVADVLRRRSSLRQSLQMLGSGVRLLPSDITLEDAAAAIQAQAPNHMFLRMALAQDDAPICLIDCAPAANILVINALAAADALVIPVTPDEDGIGGAARISRLVDWLRSADVPVPEILGYIITASRDSLRRHKIGIQRIHALGAPVLGEIPMRQGMDYKKYNRLSYQPIVDLLVDRLGEVGHA